MTRKSSHIKSLFLLVSQAVSFVVLYGIKKDAVKFAILANSANTHTHTHTHTHEGKMGLSSFTL